MRVAQRTSIAARRGARASVRVQRARNARRAPCSLRHLKHAVVRAVLCCRAGGIYGGFSSGSAQMNAYSRTRTRAARSPRIATRALRARSAGARFSCSAVRVGSSDEAHRAGRTLCRILAVVHMWMLCLCMHAAPATYLQFMRIHLCAAVRFWRILPKTVEDCSGCCASVLRVPAGRLEIVQVLVTSEYT